MKRLLAIIVLLPTLILCQVAFAQAGSDRDAGIERNEDTGLFEFRTVIEAEGVAIELFRRSRVWLVRNTTSGQGLRYEDQKNNSLASDLLVGVTHTLVKSEVEMTIQIDCRDNRCRIIFTDFHYWHAGRDYEGGYDRAFEEKITRGKRLREKTKAKIDAVIEDLVFALTTGEVDDEW